MLRRLVIAGCLLALSVLLIGSPAEASGNHMGNHYAAAVATLAFNSWPTILAGLCGFMSAQATALLTHKQAPQWIKSGVNLLLTSLGAVLITITVVAGKTWKDYVGEILMAWIASLGTHFSGLTALIGNSTANVGIGANSAPLVTPPADASDGGAY